MVGTNINNGGKTVSNGGLDLGSVVVVKEVDLFEWGGPVSDRYIGTTSEFEINQDPPVFEGSYSLKSVSTQNTVGLVSYPDDGVEDIGYQPERGDTIIGLMSADTASGFLFFGEEGTEPFTDFYGYLVGISPRVDSIRLVELSGNSYNNLDVMSTQVAANTKFKTVIKSDGEQITTKLTNTDTGDSYTLSGSDSTHDGKGFGYRKRTDGVWDDVRAKLHVGAGLWSLEKTVIDDGLNDPDAFTLYDVNGNGKKDAIVGNGFGGQVWWYEQGATTDDWTQHTIQTGYDQVEGTGAADVDGDGLPEVAICDQTGYTLSIASADSSDPTGSWTTTILDNSAERTQTARFFDLDGDGTEELVYTVEGSNSTDTGEYGVRFQKYNGGDPAGASNWTQHEIVQVPGAFWLPYEMMDLSGNGVSRDLVVSCRLDHAWDTGGIRVLKNPGDPTDSWDIESYGTGNKAQICSFADLTGDGVRKDVITHESPNSADGSVFFYEYDGGTHDYDVSVWQGSDDGFNNVFAHDWSDSDRSDLFLFNDTQGQQQIWVWDGSKYVVKTETSGAKVQDDVYTHDFDGDGTDDYATVSINGGEAIWVRVKTG